jgi:hypothetical protein
MKGALKNCYESVRNSPSFSNCAISHPAVPFWRLYVITNVGREEGMLFTGVLVAVVFAIGHIAAREL